MTKTYYQDFSDFRFQKVFPTSTSFKYHQYFDGSRYYNMLFDAWENKYSNNRGEGKNYY